MFVPVSDLPLPPIVNEDATCHILAIGIETYPSSKLGSLQFAARDALELAAAFQTHASKSYREMDIRVLVHEQARRESILTEFEELAKRVGPRDLTVVFLAGHGVNDPETSAFYFAPSDFREDRFVESAIAGRRICEVLWALPGRRILIADTCHAGNLINAEHPNGSAFAALESTLLHEVGSTRRTRPDARSTCASLAILMATGAYGIALEARRFSGGVFSRALIEGLSGCGHNGATAVTLRGLFSYVRNRVRMLTSAQQEPCFAVAGGEADYEILRPAPRPGVPQVSTQDPFIGRTICGFKLLSRIEQTPRHTLYTGVSESNPRHGVQLRALARELSRDPGEVQRFHQSAQILRQLALKDFATIHELGRLPDGRYHIIVDTEGMRRLRDMLACGPLSPLVAARLIVFLANALGTIHRAQIIYGSLTPARILVSEELDRFLIADGDRTCQTGTPSLGILRPPQELILDEMDCLHYCAPELHQIGDSLNDRVDSYALGAVGCHVLTGRPPFIASTVAELAQMQRTAPTAMERIRQVLPAAGAALIERMLAPDASQRPDMAEVAQTFAAISKELPTLEAETVRLPVRAAGAMSGESELCIATPPTEPITKKTPRKEADVEPTPPLPAPAITIQESRQLMLALSDLHQRYPRLTRVLALSGGILMVALALLLVVHRP